MKQISKEEKMTMLMNSVSDADIIPKFYERTGGIKLHILVSYPYLPGNAVKLTTRYREMIESLALDPGAYSKHMGTSSHLLSDCSCFINRYGQGFNPIFNFDDDFDDPEHNADNLRYLQERFPDQSRKIVPVVHDVQDPLGEIEMYKEMGHDYIAIGSNRALTDSEFQEIKQRWPDLNLHIFGSFRRDMLFNHKPYSADAASFIHQARFDLIYYWDEINHEEYTVRVGKSVGTPDSNIPTFAKFPHRKALEKFLKTRLGFTRDDLLGDEDNMRIVNLYFFSQLEAYINATGTSGAKKKNK
jgi:hypothetical protein